MKPFENPAKLANDPRGMTYGKAAALAGGTLALAYYIMMRRDTRQPVAPPRDVGTTQQVATKPPSKKVSVDEKA